MTAPVELFPLDTCPTCRGSGKGPWVEHNIQLPCEDCGGSGKVHRELARLLRRPAVDFVARFAEAWDGTGRNAFRPYSEHEALLTLAGLNKALALCRWRDLQPLDRRRLIFAGLRAVELGRAAAWCYGEGQGA